VYLEQCTNSNTVTVYSYTIHERKSGIDFTACMCSVITLTVMPKRRVGLY